MKKFNNRAISTGIAAIVIVLMLIGLVFAGLYLYTGGDFSKLSLGGNNNITPTGQPQGSFTIKTAAFDSNAPTTARTVATDVIVNYYVKIGGSWVSTGTAATTAAYDTVTLGGNEGGIIYAVCSTSSSYYVDSAKTTLSNARISDALARATSVTYQNVIGTMTTPQWVFPIDMHNLVPGNRATADITIAYYLITYDSGVTITRGTNQTGVGTALNTTYIMWYATCSAVNKGIALKQIVVSVNDTDTTAETFYKQNIPGIGFLSGGSLNPITQASAITYTWTAPSNPNTGAVDLGSCVYWNYGSGSVNKFDLETGIQFTLPSGRTEAWSITIYWLTPAGVGGSAVAYWQGAA